MRISAKPRDRRGGGISRRQTRPESRWTAIMGRSIALTAVPRRVLPAVLAAAEIALTSAASATLRAIAPLRRPSLVHHQRATHQRPAIAGLNRLVRKCIIVDFDKPEPSGFTTETVPQDVHAVYMDSCFFKKSL